MNKKNNIAIKLFLDICFDFAGAFLYAVGIYTFARAAQYATGGVSGIALTINHLLPLLPIGTLTLLINVPVIIICVKIVGKRFIFSSFRTMAIVAFCTDVVAPFIPEYSGDKILASVFSGVLIGLGLSIIYMRGTSSGGTDFIVMSIKKLHPHISLGQLILATDCIIILLGGFVFGNIDAVLYGIITTFMSSIIIDKMIYGAGGGKLVIIISQHGEKIAKLINENVKRGATLVNAVGAHTGKEKHMILCVVQKHQVFKVRNLAHEIDEKAFITISEAGEIFGEGFAPHI